MRISIAAALVLSCAVARAEPPVPAVATVELVDGGRPVDFVVPLGPGGEPGELFVAGPGAASTRVKLRRLAAGVLLEVEESTAEHISFNVKGEVAAPPPGKKVLVARVPHAGGSAEISLSLK
jgi:hypothetical protein